MSDRPPRLFRNLLLAMWGLVLVMALLLFGWFTLRGGTQTAADLPIYKPVGEFELTNRDGSTVTAARLAGKPWVADFVFTSCPGVCPILSERMQQFAATVPADQVHLVSISVDPETDTPEVLQDYAARHEAADNWLFLTGSRDAIHELVQDGFQLVIDDSAKQNPPPGVPEGHEPIAHSNRFVLVDAEGNIRGYYDAFDEAELARLRADLYRLL